MTTVDRSAERCLEQDHHARERHARPQCGRACCAATTCAPLIRKIDSIASPRRRNRMSARHADANGHRRDVAHVVRTDGAG